LKELKTNNKKYLPIFLDISSKSILIIGGGNIGFQKLKMLLQFTNNITILSKEVCDEIKKIDVKVILKDYESKDLSGFDIVYACTNNENLNRQIKNDAKKIGLITNVVDNSDLCDFITPAIYKHDNITIAVSSGGTDTSKAVAIRDKIKLLLKNNINDE